MKTYDEAEAARARREHKEERNQLRLAINHVLSSPLGRWLLRRIIYQDLGLHTIYPGEDAPGMYRWAGRRESAVRLRARFMDLEPELWDRAEMEALESARARRASNPPKNEDEPDTED